MCRETRRRSAHSCRSVNDRKIRKWRFCPSRYDSNYKVKLIKAKMYNIEIPRNIDKSQLLSHTVFSYLNHPMWSIFVFRTFDSKLADSKLVSKFYVQKWRRKDSKCDAWYIQRDNDYINSAMKQLSNLWNSKRDQLGEIYFERQPSPRIVRLKN